MARGRVGGECGMAYLVVLLPPLGKEKEKEKEKENGNE